MRSFPASLSALRSPRWSSYPQYPVRLREDLAWGATRARLRDSERFIPPRDFLRFRYALVRTLRRQSLETLDRAMAPEGRLVARRGLWSLYESTLPVLALDVPEPPAPQSLPPDLGERLRALDPGYPLPTRPLLVARRGEAPGRSREGAAAQPSP